MKPVIIIAIAFVLLIPVNTFAEYYDLCDIDCIPDNYQFGDDRRQDMEVIVCEDKLRLQEKLIVDQCEVTPQFYEKPVAELKQLWGEIHGPVIPEFYPMEPIFKQFTDDDAFCLLEQEDYKDCLADNGPFEDIEINKDEAYTLLYQGCHNSARNLIASGEMTREEASYVFNVCEVFPDYILEVRETIPVEQSEEKREYTLEEALEIQRNRTGSQITNDSSSVENTYFQEELTSEMIEEMREMARIMHLPPLKQFKIYETDNSYDINCKSGLDLIVKKSNGLPACVKPETAEKLIQRGWAIS